MMIESNAPTSSNAGEQTSPKGETVGFVAGCSGGHLLPAITLATKHKIDFPSDKVLFFSTNTDLDKKIIDDAGIIDHYIPLSLDKSPTSFKEYPRFIWNMAKVFWSCIKCLRAHKPSKIVSLGSYISIPVCLAAYMLRIPIDMYELNVIPGKANSFIAPLARTIYISFGSTSTHFRRACSFVGYPLRFTRDPLQPLADNAWQALHLSPDKKTLLVLGGSQGSVFVNSLVKKWLEQVPPVMYPFIQVIHQTGGNEDPQDWKLIYRRLGIQAVVFDFTSLIEYYYRAADLVICRSGAGTLFEALYFYKRCITIPLETKTTDHQLENARTMAHQYPYLFTMLTHKEIETDPARVHALITDRLMGKVNIPQTVQKRFDRSF